MFCLFEGLRKNDRKDFLITWWKDGTKAKKKKKRKHFGVGPDQGADSGFFSISLRL